MVYKEKKNFFWKAADTIAPGIAIGQAIGRIGCDIFGIPMKTVYPWGIKVGSQIVHPVQMYEMILDLFLFAFLWRKKSRINYDGELFIKYIIGFSMNRIIVEFFRTNPVIIKPFTIVHITSFIMIIIAIIAGRIIKNRCQIEQYDVLSNKAEMPVYRCILIFFVGIAGIIIYYYVNSNL